jgi:hypothetical protein
MYQSPSYGSISLERLKKIVTSFMSKDKNAHYNIIVGTDSEKSKEKGYDFVSALVVHRVGHGGIYFWQRELYDKKMGLKERIYHEATMSLMTAENFVSFFQENGIAKYDIQIHVDIGQKGETRELITELVGMVRSNGYDVKIKPESYGASKVADKYT